MGMRWGGNVLRSLKRPSCLWKGKRPCEMETERSTESCKRVERQSRWVRGNEVSPSRSMCYTSTLVGTNFTHTFTPRLGERSGRKRWTLAGVQSVEHGPRARRTIESRSFDLTEVNWCRRTRWPMSCTPQHGSHEGGRAVKVIGAVPQGVF